jgi:pimeloyl-ACP methyl ester carboxylesterase
MQETGLSIQAALRQSPGMTTIDFRSLPDATCFTVATPDGAVLPVYALDGPAGAPSLLFGHANGLAAGSYAPWLRELARRFAVFAFDARGHGGARWPEGPLDQVFHVDRFADDLALVAAAVAARRGGVPLHYAGHSLNAAAALRLAGRGGAQPWSRLVLFEPPIFPPPDSPHHAEAAQKQTPLIERSAARRAQWASPEALFAALSARSVFARFRRDMLAAHCRATLKPLADGGFTLACPPAVESAIFRAHRVADTWQRLAAARGDIVLVSGDPTLPERGWVSALMPDMAAALGAALTVLPGADHMMICEQPETCRDLLLRCLERPD